MKILIKNVNAVLPDGVKKCDVLIENGKIAGIEKKAESNCDRVIDGQGKHLLYGFTDLHCHLREPGFEYKENFDSGLKAAVHGGFTAVCPMPNTKPCVDNSVVVRYINERAKEVNLAKVYPIGAISKGQNGEELAEILSMREAGIVGVSDDGKPVSNSNLMRLCLEYIKPFDLIAFCHCEDKELAAGGSVNEGYNATVAGLKGITRAAEEVMTARDILLCETFGGRVHIAHVSTKGSVELIRQAKHRGVNVTAETCPHYLAGDDSMILNYDANAKVNPPLRESEDVEAVTAGLLDGTLDAISTDHAPHHADEKNVEFETAAFGISGFETAFALSYTALVKSGKADIVCLSKWMSKNPCRILGKGKGEIAIGEAADLVLADLDERYKIDSREFFSKGKNTPFQGKEVYGRICLTMVDGDIKYERKGENNIC